VLATAFAIPAAVVDTNVGRVLARAVAARSLRAAEAQELADSLVPEGLAREWNLALMDFGSLVCRARQPLCARCPVASVRVCAWRRTSLDGGDDPAVGSAGVTARQGRFAGSDREGRGRIVRAACLASVPRSALAAVAGWPSDPDRAWRVARALIADGVLVEDGCGGLRLP
jgi:A/G-specific adenine glycosylase